MTAGDSDVLADLQHDLAAKGALKPVLGATPHKSPQWMPLAHAMALLAGWICQAEWAAAGIRYFGRGRAS